MFQSCVYFITKFVFRLNWCFLKEWHFCLLSANVVLLLIWNSNFLRSMIAHYACLMKKRILKLYGVNLFFFGDTLEFLKNFKQILAFLKNCFTNFNNDRLFPCVPAYFLTVFHFTLYLEFSKNLSWENLTQFLIFFLRLEVQLIERVVGSSPESALRSTFLSEKLWQQEVTNNWFFDFFKL